MKIVTWNVNSIRVREARLIDFLQRHEPDIVCLQELKAQTENFPYAAIQALGYHAAVYGQKTYNGVAIIAKHKIEDVQLGFAGVQEAAGDDQARLIAATVRGVRVLSVYVPNGSEVGSEKYAYKLCWLQYLAQYLQRYDLAQQPLVIAGDFNVAPRDCDVAEPQQWRTSVLCCDEIRVALQAVCNTHLIDVFAQRHPDGGIYSWWDYRTLAFAKDNGLRIDLIYATMPMACLSQTASVDRDERKGDKPSDHAPVMVDFRD